MPTSITTHQPNPYLPDPPQQKETLAQPSNATMPPPPPPPHTQSPNALHANTFFNTVLNNPQAASSNTPPRAARPSEQSGFSATQRGLQARGKNYNGPAAVKSAESYEQRQRREEAACILESVEMLIWYAASRNESITQTRNHYQNILYGVANTEDVAWEDEWDVPVQERVRTEAESPRAAGKAKESAGKGKKRVSLGQGQN
ncbi:hypothetical protein BKA66DRAFT_471790 [Pyrenochaeta sp. MPI-SDFR-AT-0127]|nr:hypothetical protein BKA66DRAFT_471790 [Pyrenochaeta sp. MPI-SDFR-AT-0127]